VNDDRGKGRLRRVEHRIEAVRNIFRFVVVELRYSAPHPPQQVPRTEPLEEHHHSQETHPANEWQGE